MDTFESEIESLQAGKKKRIDKDKQDRVDELKTKLDKHRYHIRKLETLLRMLDNMSVEVNTVSFLNWHVKAICILHNVFCYRTIFFIYFSVKLPTD